MRNDGRFLGMVPLAGRPLLAAAAVPNVGVELRQGTVVKQAVALIDTGMNGTHVTVPKTLAFELGILATGKAIQKFISGPQQVLIGKLDLVTLPGMATCSVANAKVTIYDGDRVYLGQPFLAATGTTIEYQAGGAGLFCSGKPSPAVGVFPQFSFDVVNKNRREILTGILDTGFYGGLALPADVAARLGVDKKSTTTISTPGGAKLEVAVSSVDNISFTGHPKCIVNNLETIILPDQAPLKAVIVGEDFLKKLPIVGVIGYDEAGAYTVCAADETKIGAAKTVYLTVISSEKPTLIAPEDGNSAWVPWMVGGVAVSAVAAWLALRR